MAEATIERDQEASNDVERGRWRLATRALRHRGYRYFFSAALLANLGGWLAGMALGYLTYVMTGSPALLGTVAFCQTIPAMVLIPFAGVAVDRWPRKPMLLIAQSMFVLTSATTAVLIATGHIRVWHIMALALIEGVAMALCSPAWQSLTVELVGPEDLLNAVALNSMQFNVSRILGCLASGVFYDLLGPTWCFSLDALLLLAATICLAQVPMRPPSPKASRTGPVLNFVAGVRYLRRHEVLMALVGMASSATVFSLTYMTMLPVFARTVLHGGARTQSYLLTAIGVGALMAAFCQAMERSASGRGRAMLVSQAVMAVCIMLFAFSKHLPTSLIALVGSGAAMVGFNTTANTTMQLLVPDHMRGRLMGAFMLAAYGLTPIGSLFIGGLAQWLSAPVAVGMGALLTLTIAVLTAARCPRLLAT